jgi:dUTPase
MKGDGPNEQELGKIMARVVEEGTRKFVIENMSRIAAGVIYELQEAGKRTRRCPLCHQETL